MEINRSIASWRPRTVSAVVSPPTSEVWALAFSPALRAGTARVISAKVNNTIVHLSKRVKFVILFG